MKSYAGWPLAIIALWALVALGGSQWGGQGNEVDLREILRGPGAEAILGFDDLGRPVFDRLIAGARVSFLVAIGTILVTSVTGTLIGMIAGFSGGWLDKLVLQLIDIFLAFPGILLAIALSGILGPGIENVVIALSVVGWVGFARLARAQVLVLRHADHVHAARSLGTGSFPILIRHILPLIAAPLIVEATFGIGGIVIAEAGLSFLGLGIQAPDASWGSMIRDGTRYLLVAPHLVIAPGVALMLVVLSVNLFGDRLRDALDVRLRQQ